MKVTDYFAELYVAGRFADAGWNVYFPHRDKGFDFIIAKKTTNSFIAVRPVQVKGKYPENEARNRKAYGYIGRLTEVHSDMVLAIAHFAASDPTVPRCVAYMPFSRIRPHAKRGFICEPAAQRSGLPMPRREFQQFFDESGLESLETNEWGIASTHD